MIDRDNFTRRIVAAILVGENRLPPEHRDTLDAVLRRAVAVGDNNPGLFRGDDIEIPDQVPDDVQPEGSR